VYLLSNGTTFPQVARSLSGIGQNNERMFYSPILHDITNSKRCKEKAVQNQYEGGRKSV
jgi:hypothetical protein